MTGEMGEVTHALDIDAADEHFHARSDHPHWNESGWFGVVLSRPAPQLISSPTSDQFWCHRNPRPHRGFRGDLPTDQIECAAEGLRQARLRTIVCICFIHATPAPVRREVSGGIPGGPGRGCTQTYSYANGRSFRL
jgi:hypothetical protein